MKALFFTTLTLSGLLFSGAAPAQADLLCAKKKVGVKNGKVNFAAALSATSAAACPSGTQLVKDLGEPSVSPVIAFATVDRQAAIKTFGGSAVTAVSATQDQAGADSSWYRVTFTGDFTELSSEDSEANRNRVAVLATPIVYDYPALSASVSSAKRSEIKVDIAIWKSDALFPLSYQGGFYISLLSGAAG